MSLEIPLLAPTLLALFVLALLIVSLRPHEGFRVRFGWRFKARSLANETCQFYDAFSGRQPKFSTVRAAKQPNRR